MSKPLHKQKVCILVLGMHRSGTSALTRVINLLGASLPKSLVAAGRGNEAGHWESEPLVALNDQLLFEAGGAWNDWRPLSLSNLSDERLAYFKAEITRLIREQFGGSQLFVLKDPRICRLLPLYKEILSELNVAVRPILMIRDPYEVIESLQQRDGTYSATNYLVWLQYVLDAVKETDAPHPAVISYDRLLSDWRGAIAAASAKLEITWPKKIDAVGESIDEFLSPALRHHRFPEHGELVSPLRVSGWIDSAWRSLLALEQSADPEEALEQLNRIRQELLHATPLIAQVEDEIRGALRLTNDQVLAITAERAAAEGARRTAEQEFAVAQQERAEAVQARVSAEGKLVLLQTQLSRITSELAHRDEARAATEQALASAQAQLSQAKGELAQAQTRIDELSASLLRLERKTAPLRRPLPPMLQRPIKIARHVHAVARNAGVRAAFRFVIHRSAARLKSKLRRTKARFLTIENSDNELAPIHTMADLERGAPVVSILMPVYNTPADILDAAIQSVLSQSSATWELCICDDCSTSPETLAVLDRYRGLDWRIKITRSATNMHIAGATNLALQFATGQFVAFLDHDDVLAPDAIASVQETLRADKEIDLVYTDEDKIETDGRLGDPYLKPDWSPEYLYSVMYVLHFTVIRKALVLELGGLREAYSGAQDYDLVLRASDRSRRVAHIPKVLYHWRKIPGSAADKVDAKPDALLNARRAIADFVSSKDPGAKVVDGQLFGTFRVRWSIDHARPVTLLILTDARSKRVEGRGEIMLLENFLASVWEKSTYDNYRVLVVDNGNIPATLKKEIVNRGGRVVSYKFEGQFNFSAKMNFALRHVETEDVILLNDDLEVISPDWIESLLEQSQRDEIGAVGARLLFANGAIQHAGVVLGVNGSAAHLFHNLSAGSVGYYGFTHVIRNYSVVTGAVLATRMSVVRRVGYFDEGMRIDFNDTDFCLKVGEAGYRVVYTPFAELYHFEGSTQTRVTADQSDVDAFFKRWRDKLTADPFYHPLLPKDRVDCHVDNWFTPNGVGSDTTEPLLTIRRVKLAPLPANREVRLSPTAAKLGVNFIGPVDVVSGLGVSARGYIEALRAGGVEVNVIPYHRGFEHQQRLAVSSPATAKLQSINLIHLNADVLDEALPKLKDVVSETRFNIGIWSWELLAFRPEWMHHLTRLDEIWCSSEFMARAFASVSCRPVRVLRPALTLNKAPGGRNRASFGLSEKSFVFGYAFDVGSRLERKNPHALIEAFLAEFDGSATAQLLLKLNYATLDPGGVDEILRRVGGHKNVVVLNQVLTSGDFADLWNAIDCYVSPHRSEGLGLTMIEAMAAGKPVIATPYSGAADFVTESTAMPIDFRLTEIKETIEPYPRGFIWAEPSVASLRSAMRKLYEDRALAEQLGRRGQRRIDELFSPQCTGKKIRAEIDQIMLTRGADISLSVPQTQPKVA